MCKVRRAASRFHGTLAACAIVIGAGDAKAQTASVPRPLLDELHRACHGAGIVATPGFTPPPSVFDREEHGARTVRPPVDLRRREVEIADEQVRTMTTTDPRRADLLFHTARTLLDLADERRQAGDAPAAQRFTQGAATRLAMLVSDHPTFARGDEAVYLLGRARFDSGDDTGGRAAFLDLVRRYPQSAFVPFVYAHFGEYYLAQADTSNARQFFERVVTYDRTSPLWAVATYRLAWIARNEHQTARAQSLFAAVVQWARTDSRASALPGLELAAHAEFCGP